MRGAIQIGRIIGIPISINPSWFLILGVVIFSLATRVFPVVFDDQPRWVLWLLSVTSALIFFVSIILHELGHSVVARYFGIPVSGITLFVLGAVAQTTRETRRPGQEFLMAAAGPAVSLLLAGFFMVLWFISGQGGSMFSRVCEWLWLMNFFVGLFNLIPAYPMDGGRILRSALWGLTGNWRRSTSWAAWTGRGFACLLIGAGVLAVIGQPEAFAEFGAFSGVQFILLGVFINFAARQSDSQAGLLTFLNDYRVGDVMVRDIPAITAGATVRQALDGPLVGYGAGREWLFVSAEDHFVGVAPRPALQVIPDERADATLVDALVIPAARLTAVPPEELLGDLLQRMEGEDQSLFVVVDQGEVVGLVHRGVLAGLIRRQAGISRG